MNEHNYIEVSLTSADRKRAKKLRKTLPTFIAETATDRELLRLAKLEDELGEVKNRILERRKKVYDRLKKPF